MSTRPDPGKYPTAWSYLWAKRAWTRSRGGNLLVTVAVAVIAGGVTGSEVAVVAFPVLAVVVTLARRRED